MIAMVIKTFMALFVIGLFITGITSAAGNPPFPILVLATDNHFGSYTAEILKAEGFNEFEIHPLEDTKVTLHYLKGFDIVILAETILSEAQKDMLGHYVKEGGSLIAFKPDKKLNDVFGIATTGTTLDDAYILIDTHTEIGNGITSQTLQFHGEADEVDLKSGKSIAALYKDAVTSTVHPAVIVNDYGHGHAMAFLYNLPKSIVFTRQGNFRNASREMDGITGIRAMDLFTNGYVNTSKNTLNQADEQMRLLTHGIEHLSAYHKPLPRFWYFPDTLKCLVTLNNDGEDSKEAEFGPQFNDVDAKRAKMTLYIKEVEYISRTWVETWTAKGFEISGHPDDTRQAGNPDWNTMDSVYKALQNELQRNYGITAMHTVTNHWFVWCGKNAEGVLDFAAQARIEENNGVALDCNYAHYDNGSDQGHFLGEMGTNQGNFTGSGLAMKFADTNGRVINVFQQLNNVYDQQYMEHKDQDGYYNCFKGLMDRSLDEVYSFISVRAHNNEYFFSKVPLLKSLDYANSKGIPVWTEQNLLDFLKAKEEATFSDIQWTRHQLAFKIKSSLPHRNGLTCMVPAVYNGKKIIKITSNGITQPYSVKSIKGFKYGMVTIQPGHPYSLVVNYGMP
ncbi:MAG TPA: hypothetical protein VK517_15985 [Cyclobacteriaceae bacterium]|nr:hypothetical protein [Cyclobacteriaceae bacterium]